MWRTMTRKKMRFIKMIWMVTLHLIPKEWREETIVIGEVNGKIESDSFPKLKSLILRERCNLKSL